MMSGADEAVQSTNDDAASCKLAAVRLGYWTDPYIAYFIKSSDRKPPEINRGYYVRVTAVSKLLTQFIKLTSGRCQVVNLGAGYDTMYWRLKDAGLNVNCWVDVDFEPVTRAKVYYIKSRRELNTSLGTPVYTKSELHAVEPGYHIISTDIRRHNDLLSRLQAPVSDGGCGLFGTVPTVFIAECLLVYMSATDSSMLLTALASTFSTSLFINYEQVNMGDRFGEVMVENLLQRGCSLAGIEHCISLDSHRQRFLSCGWSGTEAMNVMDIYKCLPQSDIQRIERIEMLDDFDNLHQLFNHYAVSWAYKDSSELNLKSISLTS